MKIESPKDPTLTLKNVEWKFNDWHEMPVVYVCSRPCEYFTRVTLEMNDFPNFASFVLIFLYFNWRI